MIDLCVTNYKTPECLARLLDAVQKEDDPTVWKMWIADNSSRDRGVVAARQVLDCDRVEHLYDNDNIGYAAACNHLASQGSGDIIGLLNADAWLTTEDLRQIQLRFDETDVAILGPKQRNEQHKITHGGIFGTQKEPEMRGWLKFDPKDEMYRDTLEAVTVSGAAYFIRRDVWDELTNCPTYHEMHPKALGAFLPTKHYYEETWCSYHAAAHGHKIVYDGTISIGHTFHASSPINSEPQELFYNSQVMFRTMCDIHGIPHD